MNTPDKVSPGGNWEVRRKIKIPALRHEADAIAVAAAIGQLAGVRDVGADVKKQQVTVLYDASKIAYQQIVDAMVHTGFPPLDNLWRRFKGNWFQFTDSNARENAKDPPSACCNKPPK